MTIEEVQLEIIDEFSFYDDWMDKYGYLIELGNDPESLNPDEKKEKYLIDGCQSRVWLIPEYKDGLISFRGESDAIIVKGLVALLLRVLSNRSPSEIIDADLHFIDDLGLKQNLSPTRSNGLVSMIKQMRLYAVAYKELEEAGTKN
ncbi:MAG: SufE family protein [Prolixibacteraceae bacterium]|nr:SufE family protein [Prolixibacteraceae bacterium]